MRIISGNLKGKKINYKPMDGVRPTMDKVRESIFNILEHSSDARDELQNLNNIRALDIFAGTGSFGFEVISRGAQNVTFLDSSSQCIRFLEKTSNDLGIGDQITILKRDVIKNLGHNPFAHKYHLVFVGAPYSTYNLANLLNDLAKGEWIENNCICVLEERNSDKLDLPNQFDQIKVRTYGGTKITFCKYKP